MRLLSAKNVINIPIKPKSTYAISIDNRQKKFLEKSPNFSH